MVVAFTFQKVSSEQLHHVTFVSPPTQAGLQ